VTDGHDLRLIAADLQLEQEKEQPGPSQGSTGPNEGEAPGGVCLVLGSEGQGLSRAASHACTPVMIPMAGR